MEANPKYFRDVIAVLGLEEAKHVKVPNVKRTPTTESLVELENERRAMYRTVVGTLLYMCLERADIMYSVKETSRNITCPTERDEMNLKRIVRYLKGVPSAKCLIEFVTPPTFVNVYTDSDWAGQATTCKSTSGGVVQWRNATHTAWSRKQQTVSLSSAEAEVYASTTGVAEVMVTKHLLQELGHEVILMNHVDSQSAKVWASTRGLGRMTHMMLKYMFVQDVVEKKLTNLAHINTKQNKTDLMTQCHPPEAHKKGCAMMVLRLACNRIERLRSNAKMKRREENVRRCQSAVMNEIREHEVERRSVRSRQSAQTSRRSADNDTSFLVKFQARVFIAMSSEFIVW